MNLIIYCINFFNYDKLSSPPKNIFKNLNVKYVYIKDNYLNEDPKNFGWDEVVYYNNNKSILNFHKRERCMQAMLDIEKFSSEGDLCLKIDANVVELPGFLTYMISEKPISASSGWLRSSQLKTVKMEVDESLSVCRWSEYKENILNIEKKIKSLPIKNIGATPILSAKFLIFKNCNTFFDLREELLEVRKTCFQGNLIYTYLYLKYKEHFHIVDIRKIKYKKGKINCHNSMY